MDFQVLEWGSTVCWGVGLTLAGVGVGGQICFFGKVGARYTRGFELDCGFGC